MMFKRDVKGPVQRLEQRTPTISGLEHIRNLEAHDVEFSHRGEVSQITYYKGSGTVDAIERFLFDGEGAHIRTVILDGDGLQTGATDLQYDTDGRCVGWLDYDATGTLQRRCEQQFAGGLLVASDTRSAAGIPVVQRTYEYLGKELVRSLFKYYGPTGDLGEQSISHCDSNGRLEETFGLTADGKPLGDGKYRYEYDANGREARVLYFNDWSTDNVPNSISLFEYTADAQGNWVERRKRHRFKNDSAWRTTVTTRKITYWSE